jgi:hypothetical protein
MQTHVKAAHNSEAEAISILQDLGMDYPVSDWAIVADKLLNRLAESIGKIRLAISNK